MEYIKQRGSFDDLPLEEIFETFADIYKDWERGEDGKVRHISSTGAGQDEAFRS